MDSDVGRDGEEGYNLREMGSDGQGGWEEGGVDGSAGGGVSATAAAMEWSMSGVGGNSAWSVEKVCWRMGRMATSSGRWRMMGGEVGKRVVWMDRLGLVYPPQPQPWNGRCRVGGNFAWGKLDSEVGREGEEGYELREMGSDGQGGWEEGGVDGSAGGGVSATAAAMERSID